ncbi:MAG: DUF2339 domain-containing protein [Burkholderiaceae bacterium]
MLQFFVIAAGAVGGSVLGGVFGALAGAALAWLAWASRQQASEIASLRRDLDIARRGVQAAAGPLESPLPHLAQPMPAAAPQDAPASAQTQASAVAPIGTPDAPDTAPDTAWRDEPHDTEAGSLWGEVSAAPTPGTALPAPADTLAGLSRWLLGGNTIVKLGVAILFVGLAFLAKFAVDQVNVPVEVRLAGIAGAALGLLAIGWRLRVERAAYAQVLQGGAVAVLYLTLFVAFRFYSVLALAPVFACMVAVAVLAAALAVLQDARALALIGALGGFATPLLVSTGAGDHVALFSYYLVLDLGIAAIAWHKDWRVLNLIGFFATFLVGTAWGVLSYRAEHYALSQVFLIAFFTVFVAILLLPVRRALREDGQSQAAAQSAPETKRSDAWVNASLLFGLPTVTFALQHGLVRHFEYGTALSAMLLAWFYVGLALWMRSRPLLAVTFEASLAIATVFLTLVIPFALDAHSTAGAWALEGTGLVWLGLRQQRLAPRLFGYLLLFLAGLAMFHAFERHGMPEAFFNSMLFNGLIAAAAALAAAHFVRLLGASAMPAPATEPASRIANIVVDSARRAEAAAEPLLIAWGTLWLLVTSASQIANFAAPHFQLTAWLACISVIAVVFTALSLRLAWPRIAWPVLGHAPLLVLGVGLLWVTKHSPGQDGGWWAWPLALAAHLFVLRHACERWPAPAAHAVHTLGLLVLAALGALQGRAITAHWGDPAGAWPWLGWLVVPAALLMLLPRAGFAARWPVQVVPAAYQTHAGSVLTAGLLAWTVLANVASNGAALPLPHLPLLNPLDLGVGAALLAAWLWQRSAAAPALWSARPALALAVTAAAGFIWLNAILVRAFHHYGGVAYRTDAWIHSLAVQTGISLLWSVTALVLMWWAARRALRAPWLVGAALLAAVVLKLVLVDLSGTGTITRIVSFIGVGVSMLLIGYVAPLPGATAREAPHARA